MIMTLIVCWKDGRRPVFPSEAGVAVYQIKNMPEFSEDFSSVHVF